jgi:SAM-dependent methyltransferase
VDDRRKGIVAEGYDAIARRYLAWGAGVEGDPRDEMVARLAAQLPDGAQVLDLGCGAGTTARQLSPRFAVTGLDISRSQVELARQTVPNATFEVADIGSVDFPDASWDAVVALYSISHVPREEHAALFARIGRWLKPGGRFLASLGAADGPDWTGEWLGVPMFFSAWDAETNRRLLRDAGLTLESSDVRTMQEPEGEVSFLWVLARSDA